MKKIIMMILSIAMIYMLFDKSFKTWESYCFSSSTEFMWVQEGMFLLLIGLPTVVWVWVRLFTLNLSRLISGINSIPNYWFGGLVFFSTVSLGVAFVHTMFYLSYGFFPISSIPIGMMVAAFSAPLIQFFLWLFFTDKHKEKVEYNQIHY